MTARAEQSASHKISDRARLSPAALAAGGVGNLLEWYDFGVYGYFAPVLARLFFPSDDPLASLIGAYGGFAGGFANAAYWCCGSWNHRRPRRTALRAVSGYSVAFNLGLGIAGGTAPAIATALIAATGFTLAPAFYLMLAAAAAGIAAFLMADRSREELP